MAGYWWQNGTGLDPVEIDPDGEPGGNIELTIGDSAPVAMVLGSDNFPCLDDDERPTVDAEALELAREMVRRFNAFPDLLAACVLALSHISNESTYAKVAAAIRKAFRTQE